MKKKYSVNKRVFGFEWGVVPLLATFTAITLFYALSKEPKWMIFIIMAILFCYGIIIIKEREKFFLYMSVIFLPINLDFHLIYLPPLVYRPVNGMIVSGFDLFFFLAFFSWIFRYIADPKEKIKFFPHISIPFLLMWALAIIGIGQNAAPSLIKAWSLWIVFRNYLVFLYLESAEIKINY